MIWKTIAFFTNLIAYLSTQKSGLSVPLENYTGFIVKTKNLLS